MHFAHFASNITESVSLKIFLFLGSIITLVNNVMSCFYLIFAQLICLLNFILSSLSLQSILLLFVLDWQVGALPASPTSNDSKSKHLCDVLSG